MLIDRTENLWNESDITTVKFTDGKTQGRRMISE
jgi:hypothetical protein